MVMLSLAAIKKEALRVARKYIGARQVDRVLVKPDQDWEGLESVSITIVLKSSIDFTREMVGGITFDLNEFMVRNNDDRFAYTHYASVEDLEQLSEGR
jgi:hypothetical protein